MHSVSPRCKNTSELSAAVTMLNMSQACFNDRPRTRSQTRPRTQFTQSQPPPQLTQSQPQTRPRTRSRPTQPSPQFQSHTTQSTQSQPRPTQPSPQSQSHTTQSTQSQPQPPPLPQSQSHTTQSHHFFVLFCFFFLHSFDQHKLVIGTIASIIRINLEEAKPSWKKLSIGQRDSWFNIFEEIKLQCLIKNIQFFILFLKMCVM